MLHLETDISLVRLMAASLKMLQIFIAAERWQGDRRCREVAV